jgi:DNA mismatch repair protein MutS2
LLQSGTYFPNDYLLNLSKELKLLGIPGAVLSGEQFIGLETTCRKSWKKSFAGLTGKGKTTYEGLAKLDREHSL